jgi:ABC-type nitrate/sulfonate/bicarbonate transport system substrate-binding protein
MPFKTEKTTFLLNWYANPYHTPLYVAKEQGWLKGKASTSPSSRRPTRRM